MLKEIQDEPYRLFFPLGILLAIGGVGHWLFYALGWMDRYNGFLHASIQTQLYLACFVGGFLMTAVPRFSGTWTTKTWELAGSLVLLGGTAAALFFGQWVVSESFYALWLLFLARFIVARFLKRGVQYPPVEFIWIPPAVFLGVAGALSIILVLTGNLGPEWMSAGRSMQEQGFMLALVLGVGCFLGPRLMGVHQFPPGDPDRFKTLMKKKMLINASLAFLLVLSFFLEGPMADRKAYALRALVVTGVFFWTRSLNAKIISGPGFFIRLLSASYWMIALGYGLIPFFPKLRVALLHLVFLGGFSLMIFCVSTMVVLSHAGRGDLLQKPLRIFWLIGLGMSVSLGVRFAATFFGGQYFLLLGVASSAWIAIGAGWLAFAGPYLFRVPVSGASAHEHHKITPRTGNTC